MTTLRPDRPVERLARRVRAVPVVGPAIRWVWRLGRRVLGLVSEAERRNAEYNRQTDAVLGRWLKPDSRCIDVGAHRGEVLDLILRLAPSGQHYAFEPIHDLAAGLRLAYPNVRVLERALGSEPGVATFHWVQNDPGYSGLRRRLYDRQDVVVREVPVEVRTLDQCIPQDVEIAFIKLDIEGGEYHALMGARETIRRSRPLVLFEAGDGSSGCYGVSPEMFFDLLVGELDLELTTMSRWLAGSPSFADAEEFREAWTADWYFLAAPAPAGDQPSHP